MSKFEVKVIRIDGIEPIAGADMIELARINDYRSVVRKGQFKVGDLAVYIPESSILPEWLLEKMNLVGKLSGSNKNRVKAVKLRGCLSQGLLYPVHQTAGTIEVNDQDLKSKIRPLIFAGLEIKNQEEYEPVNEGDDVAELLGITKYEPPLPVFLAGQVFNIGLENTLRYDIENIKKYTEVLDDGDDVWLSEKCHGTFCVFGYVPGLEEPDLYHGNKFAGSKGLSGQGLVFKFTETNKHNLYVSMFNRIAEEKGSDIFTHIENMLTNEVENNTVKLLKPFVADVIQKNPMTAATEQFYRLNTPLYILGEIFGQGIQDLNYGFKEPQFRVFDVYIGKPGLGRYLNLNELKDFVVDTNLKMVDILYEGNFDKEIVLELTKGKTITGNGSHIREGVVIKPVIERRDDHLGRIILKSISEDYLLRKEGTEYN